MTKHHAFQRDFWRGAVDTLPLAAGVAIYGLAFGLLSAQASLTALQVGVMSGVVFAGGSQIVAVQRLVAGSAALDVSGHDLVTLIAPQQSSERISRPPQLRYRRRRL